MFGCYFIAAIVLIIWLSSEESPSQYDYTQGINPENLPFLSVNFDKIAYDYINSIET